MCTVCGCGGGETTIDGAAAHAQPHRQEHTRDHAHGDEQPHAHDHGHAHGHDHGDAHEHGHAHHRDAALKQALPAVPRLISLERDILAENDRFAAENRRHLADARTLALNLVSSPGAGKTTLLVRTIEALRGRAAVAVIEGDQQTSADADRIRAAGAPAVQINTGKGCHLDAHAVGHAMERVGIPAGGVLFIENVGNLVCPAGFDLGEAAKIVIISVTEGEDKPLKYPDIFAAARLVIVNKIDLAPHLDADIALLQENARRVNPAVDILTLSARTGEGMEAWIAWLQARLPGQPRAAGAPAARQATA